MVLIVNSSEKDGKTVAEIFHYMGILACQRKPHAALTEISLRYSAILLMHPERLADIHDYIARVRSYARTVPLFAITDTPREFAYSEYFAGVFPTEVLSARLASAMIEHCEKNGLPVVGDYRLAGIDVSSAAPTPTYFERPVALTKTETMILRYLIKCYPCRAATKAILKHAYRPSRKPELSSIRAHICAINRKWRELCGENIIDLVRCEGYRILTPLMKEKRELLHK